MPVPLTRSMTATALLLAALLTGAGTLTSWSASPAEDKAKGEEMLSRARIGFAEANGMYQASIRAAQLAQQEQALANQKRLEARKLQREAFLLIRDSSRMRASELRAQAERVELQVKTEAGELARLQGLLAHEKQTVTDTTSAAAKIRDAAANESNPTQKAELGKMAESLGGQGAQAGAEAAALEKRIVPVQAEIARLSASVRQLNDAAQKLAPMEK